MRHTIVEPDDEFRRVINIPKLYKSIERSVQITLKGIDKNPFLDFQTNGRYIKSELINAKS